ncbi:PqqD family peptide modification chaperone [Halomonas qaidamensis]|uniref:PqqD family peptide modification chaperone n=1 Tax=Halomonas qaidamensis TaxID=2866211 RepID=A0ABY6JSD1_9GAMM|nr:PqqD family peptide modification chaperone [Halomonas qaidamensis]UYV20075.1 PqqD family peptide modification chaperone [Halomonas qaidamensis]
MPTSANHPTNASTRFWLSGKRHNEQDHFFRHTLEAQGWKEGDEQEWQAAWVTGMPPKQAFKRTSPFIKMNHIPGNAALTVKSRLHASLSALQERTRHAFGTHHELVTRLDFFPHSYVMPHDYPALVEAASAHPDKKWILKPTNASKGQGVQVLSDPTTAPLAPNWLVQEYVANPHTIRGHKYVLRLYMLIAGIDPVRIYLYDQGFAKLASEPWDPNDIDNPFSQLTNPDINALNVDAEIPVEFIDLARYRCWLQEQGHDDEALFAKLHDLATLTALSAVDTMRERTREDGAHPLGCYELIGLDCLIDDQLKPWILECNLSPSLGICAKPEHGGVIEESVKGSLVQDMLSLVGLAPYDAPETFDAEALVAEQQRSGGFVALYPSASPENALAYLPYLGLPSLADYQLAPSHVKHAIAFRANGVSELIEDDQIALYHYKSGLYYQLNDSAALMWLLVSEGETIESLLDHLTAASGGQVDREQLATDLWATLTPWWQHGLLTVNHAPLADLNRAEKLNTQPTIWRGVFTLAQRRWSLSAPSGIVADQLARALAPLSVHEDADNDQYQPPESLHLLASANGYCLTTDSHVINSRLQLHDILPAIARYCMTQTARPGHVALDIALLSKPQQLIACVLPTPLTTQMLTALNAVANQHEFNLSRGAHLSMQAPTDLIPLNLPLTDSAWRPTNQQFCTAVVWLTPDTPEQQAPLSALSLLGALLAVAYEGKQGLSPEALQTLEAFCQQSQRSTLPLDKHGHQLDQWLFQHMLTPASHAAV